MKFKKITSCAIFMLLFFCIYSTGEFIKKAINDKDTENNIKSHSNTNYKYLQDIETVSSETNKETLTISAVGDIMIHDAQLNSAYNSSTKKYDFRNVFSYVKPYIENSDLALANLETTLSGENAKYSGFPLFNSPDSILDALKYTGFNVLCGANNHIYDKGNIGLLRTVEIVNSAGFNYLGVRNNVKDKNYTVKNIKRFKIGFANYTFETKSKNGHTSLNSIELDKQSSELINTFNYDSLDADSKKMKNTIDQMKEDGAEYIIFILHWGSELNRNINNNQKKLAQKLCDYGVDFIIGGHPHVIQPFNIIKSTDGTKEMPVVYSMGNFLSNQCYEELQNRYVEDGMILNLTLIKDIKTKKTSLEKIDYIPTWVKRKALGNNKYDYKIIPLEDALKKKDAFDLTNSNILQRAEDSLKHTIAAIESSSSNSLLVRLDTSGSIPVSSNTASKSNSKFLILTNRNNSLNSSYVPTDLVVPNLPMYSKLDPACRKLDRTVATSLTQLFNDALKYNINFYIQSGYRSYDIQKDLYSRRVKELGQIQADKYIALPGTSEHQTGLAVDVLSNEYGNLDDGYAKTKSYNWMVNNCAKYGFIVRYPKNKESITGYKFEPWHLRYVGQNIAKEISSKNITLEEYLKQK